MFMAELQNEFSWSKSRHEKFAETGYADSDKARQASSNLMHLFMTKEEVGQRVLEGKEGLPSFQELSEVLQTDLLCEALELLGRQRRSARDHPPGCAVLSTGRGKGIRQPHTA